jgi:hypothetical protein
VEEIYSRQYTWQRLLAIPFSSNHNNPETKWLIAIFWSKQLWHHGRLWRWCILRRPRSRIGRRPRLGPEQIQTRDWGWKSTIRGRKNRTIRRGRSRCR